MRSKAPSAERPAACGFDRRHCEAAAKAAGYDVNEFAGHSLRASLATQAAANGVSERLIMKQTRHRSLDTLRRARMCGAG